MPMPRSVISNFAIDAGSHESEDSQHNTYTASSSQKDGPSSLRFSPPTAQFPDTIRVTLSTPPNDSTSPDPQQCQSITTHSGSSEHHTALYPGNTDNNRNNLPLPTHVVRTIRQGLPQLSIPNTNENPTSSTLSVVANSKLAGDRLPDLVRSHHHHGSESSISTTPSPETPASLSSPIVGVVDLTKHVKTTSNEPEFHGGYSDIYCGEWEREFDPPETENKPGAQLDDHKVHSNNSLVRQTETIEVAIKLLRVLSSSGYDEVKARKRLNREVYVWHRLEHPNIVTFLGTSYHMSGRPSLVLPWFRNGCAPEYLRRNPDADRLKLILDISHGLQYLHSDTTKPPIVHGDLKGNNILITDDGRATLSDFGLAKVIEEICSPQPPEYIATLSDTGVGPIRWQAPELLKDDTSHPQMPGDIWSFGCTNYELLTGNIPYHFRARDPSVIQDIRDGIPPPGVEENSNNCGDEGIWDLMNDCWIARPEDRIKITDAVSRLELICGANSKPS
ncbi:hypothetical protein VKT23_010433 [Stygiomarasmius scandens]|uniref:Protein kinase domain-containing protein n=1 Tax=Marasmiellus scandens TaxID=2682957 RepID=A0ABR1JFR1_9AGAR